jgi:hypothetical protein
MGVEQGMEGGNLSEIGGYMEDLQVRTEYAHYQIAPAAAAQEITGVNQTEATVHGSVDPEGPLLKPILNMGRLQVMAEGCRRLPDGR